MKRVPNGGDCAIDAAATVQGYLNYEIAKCEHDLKCLAMQLSIDRDYVGSPEAEPAEVDYYRLQVQLEQVELEFLSRRLGILKLWQQP